MTATLFPVEREYVVPGERLELAWPGTWIFRLPCELRSLNATMWGHWRNQQRERVQFEHELAGAMAAFVALRDVEGWHAIERQAFDDLVGQRELRRVRVFRFVPHVRHLIRDDGNLRSCDKHVLDAMKRVGLIHDDRRTWLEHLPPDQFIAPDRNFWTVIKLDRPDVRASGRF